MPSLASRAAWIRVSSQVSAPQRISLQADWLAKISKDWLDEQKREGYLVVDALHPRCKTLDHVARAWGTPPTACERPISKAATGGEQLVNHVRSWPPPLANEEHDLTVAWVVHWLRRLPNNAARKRAYQLACQMPEVAP